MKTKTISGAKLAATAVALVLSGAVSASAEDKPKAVDKKATEKMSCGANGCNKSMDKTKAETGMPGAPAGAAATPEKK